MIKIFNKYPAQTALIFLLLLFITSIALIQQYISTERERDLISWQSRLGIVADMHKLSIEKLMKQQKDQLRSLSQAPTLQLYLSQFGSLPGDDTDIMHAQATYVRNLLQASAQRMGLVNDESSKINSEFRHKNSYGLAVINNQAALLFASRHFNDSLDSFQPQIQQALQTSKIQLIDLQLDAQQNIVYGFVMPVFPVQQLQSGKPIGAVILLLNPHNGLFKELSNPHLSTRSDESLLVSRRQNQLIYLSPLQAPAQIFHTMSASTTELAANFAMQQPGELANKRDYKGVNTLVTGRKINQTPWTLLQKINADEALRESDEHQQFLITSFSLLTLFLGVLLIAAWRHSTSIRLQKLSGRLEAHTILLNAVSDNINEHIFLLDNEGRFVFANRSLLSTIQLAENEILGKHASSILGTDTISSLQTCHDNKQAGCILSLCLGQQQNTYHVSIIRLSSGAHQGSSLYVLHNISQIQEMQAKRDRLAQGIIGTLVKATDLHDPYCANHSERTREVAVKIAQALQLDKSSCQTLEMAALLANIGKLFVDKSILTKMEPLNEEENQQLRKHIDYAVDILKQLDFEGPVVEIIAQKNEHMDGSGYPKGLQADQLLLESRILAVANAFVAMSSSRAYRKGREISEVLDILLQQADIQFDRHIVAALFHIAENQSDWASWQSIHKTER